MGFFQEMFEIIKALYPTMSKQHYSSGMKQRAEGRVYARRQLWNESAQNYSTDQ